MLTVGAVSVRGQTWSYPAPLNDYAYEASGDDTDIQLATDGAGTWVAVWSSRDTRHVAIGTDRDILVARSADDGVTWTDPAPLNTDAATDAGNDWYPQVATDGAGYWVAVWSTWNDVDGNLGTDSDVRVAESTDNGATWSSPLPLNANAATDSGDDYRPQVVTDGSGWWMAVWHSYDDLDGTIGTDADILYTIAFDDAIPWGFLPPGWLNDNAPTDTGNDQWPQIVTGDPGSLNWMVLWVSNDDLDGTIGIDRDILMSRGHFGTGWTSPEPLNTNAYADLGDDWRPQATVDGLGNWIAAWYSDDELNGTIGNDLDILAAHSTDAGASWSAPVPLNTNAATDTGDDFHPQLTTDDAGLWLATWYTQDDLGGTIGDDRDIVIARSTDVGATWTAPAPVNHFAGSDWSSEHDYLPQVLTDAAGDWIAVWHSNYDQGTLSDLGYDYDILLSRSNDGGVSWSNAEVLNNNADDNSGTDFYQQIATDGAGNWVAVWASWDDVGESVGTDGDIFVAASEDNGLTWTDWQPLNNNASTDSGSDSQPSIHTDEAGNWVAVWSSSENLGGAIGTDADILVASSADNGATWTAPLPLNSHADSDTYSDWFPEIETNGSGTWLAVWQSFDDLGGTIGTDHDILFSTSLDNGVTWSDAQPLNNNASTDAGEDYFPHLTTDAVGNWLAVWHSDDSLSGTVGLDRDILVSASSDNGSSWTDPQPLNANAGVDSGDDWRPSITTDLAGNWITVWYSDDDLNGTIGTDTDILYAVSADNGMTWTYPQSMNGADTDSGGDWEPQVSTDAAGNWMIAWASNEDVTGTIGADRDIVASISMDNGASWTDPQPLNANADLDSGSDSNPQIAGDSTGTWVAVWDSYDTLAGTIGSDLDIFVARTVYPAGNIIIDPGGTGATDVVQDPDGASILLANPLVSPLDLRPDDLAVGNTSAGEVAIRDHGQVFSALGRVGYQSGATGAVTVDGAGSLWSNDAHLYVGMFGQGTVMVSDGGAVSVGGTGRIANEAGSIGTVVIEGPDSTWTTASNLDVGWRGDGALTIQDGGTVSNSYAHIANHPDSVGEATVDGAGSQWQCSARMHVGSVGTGSLVVQNGGVVSCSWGYIGTELNATGSGTATVDGEGSEWNIDSQLYIGVRGHGTLAVQNGGTVSTGGSSVVGNQDDATGIITVDGAGSLWDTTHWLDVGDDSEGLLTIQDGGTVSNNNARIGHWENGVGEVAVDGVGSTWACRESLWIGDAGDGTLTIRDGGVVSVAANAVVDAGPTSHGTLAFVIGVNGPGLLDIAGSLTIGESSTLRVTIDPEVTLAVGQQFVLATSIGGIAGTCTDHALPTVVGGSSYTWDVIYDATEIRLDLLAIDFDDCNSNGIPDWTDLADGTSLDCNLNDVPDECDLDTAHSADCNSNGIPDECEDDCNGNGLDDACDIAAGTSQDVNENGRPDECDRDCNHNGRPDDLDITDGTSLDCNANGWADECEADCNRNSVPDDCDIVTGVSSDCDSNGWPDECDPKDLPTFANCFSGPEAAMSSGCDCADFDGDGDGDLLDFAQYQREYRDYSVVHLSNGTGGGDWFAPTTWASNRVPALTRDYELAFIVDGDTVTQYVPLPFTLGHYHVAEGASHVLYEDADVAALSVEVLGDIVGLEDPDSGVRYVPLRNSARILINGPTPYDVQYDDQYCSLLANAPVPLDDLPPCSPARSANGEDGDRGDPPRFQQTSTHPSLTVLAVRNSACNMGPYYGSLSTIGDFGTALALIVQGTIDEDEPFTRVFNHFYNPVNDLGICPPPACFPAPQWAQDAGFNDYNFVGARLSYWFAVTDASAEQRAEFSRDMFLALGHILHLIQDMGSVAHTRGDAHIEWFEFEESQWEHWAGVNYGDPEDFVAKLPEIGGDFTSGYSNSHEEPDFNAFEQWWDTGQWTGQPEFRRFDDTYPKLAPGLAEYVNFNFLSQDTVWSLTDRFDADIPRPNVHDTNLQELFAHYGDHPLHPVRYVQSGAIDTESFHWKDVRRTTPSGPGVVRNIRLARARYNPILRVAPYYPGMGLAMPQFVELSIINDGVYQDYAANILPKTIAYCTAFVNYFFRGRLEVHEEFVWVDPPGEIQFRLTICNDAGEGETFNGSSASWALYHQAEDETTRTRINGVSFTSYPGTLPHEACFVADSIPLLIGEYFLVYRGSIGTEIDTGVAVGGFSYYPDPG